MLFVRDALIFKCKLFSKPDRYSCIQFCSPIWKERERKKMFYRMDIIADLKLVFYRLKIFFWFYFLKSRESNLVFGSGKNRTIIWNAFFFFKILLEPEHPERPEHPARIQFCLSSELESLHRVVEIFFWNKIICQLLNWNFS